jgi:hypothetical protein
MELSKKDKKTCRELIEAGLQREFTSGLEKAESILCNWKTRNKDIKETYYTLYEMIRKFDKHIGRRYDGVTGSHYLSCVAGLVMDQIIFTEELNPFSDEARAVILRMSNITKR